jgi:hypothetical protein
MANEKRTAPRRRVLQGGSINFDGAAIRCTIRNLSATGAALDVETPVSVPDCFKLVVEGESLDRRCHVVWREKRRIGVAFD